MNKSIGIGITEPLMRFYPFKNEIIEGVKAAEEDMANKISGSQYHFKIPLIAGQACIKILVAESFSSIKKSKIK